MDKKKTEEKQELAKLFAKNVNEAIHILSEKQGWNDGSPEKIALHSFFAGIEGELSGNGFMSGALAGGINEAAVAKLMKTLGPNNPDLVQIASAALGYATNKLAGEDALAGAALAQWGTKDNFLHMFVKDIIKKLDLSRLNDNQYYEISLSFGPKVVNGQFSVLVNKYGDVFDSYGASIGISADALPIRADINIITVNGLGDSEKSMKEKMRDYMKGGSITGGITLGHMNYSASLSLSSLGIWDKYSYAYGISSTDGALSGGGSYTLFIGNINDEYIWKIGNAIQEEHNKKVLAYYRMHKNEENLKLYINRFNTFVLIKEAGNKVSMYSTIGKGDFIHVPRFKFSDSGLLLYRENEA